MDYLTSLQGMKKVGALVRECLDDVEALVKPGVTTRRIEDFVDRFIYNHRARSATRGYKGYPFVTCTSVNSVAYHGIPDTTALVDGDIVSVDVALEFDGWYGDSCRTFTVGLASLKDGLLIATARHAMIEGINAVRPNATTGDIGHAISAYVSGTGFKLLPDTGGHGIGTILHDHPFVPSHGKKGTGELLRPGMFITVEPILVAGSPRVYIQDDGWSFATRDKAKAAQFEHTVAVTETGCMILT